MIVRVSEDEKDCCDIDRHFDNLSESRQSQMNCESSVDVLSLRSLFRLVVQIGRLSVKP